MIKELLTAVEMGDIEFINVNLTSENVNLVDHDGFSVAMVAARRNDLEMIKVLAQYGADFDQKSKAGQSALDWAYIYNNQDMIDFIKKCYESNPKKNKV